MLFPTEKVPALVVPTNIHGVFDLSVEPPAHFTMLVFFRGLHCPLCVKYLKELATLLPVLEEKGVKAVAISSDTEQRSLEMAAKVGAPELTFGYGLPLQMARDWGLYLSKGIGKTSVGIEEPAVFAEPGLFLVRPDGTLYYGAVQTMPFARPGFTDLMMAID